MTPSFVVTPDANARVQRCLDQFIVEHDTPGMQYLFLSADAVLYAYHGGMANLVDHVPVTSSTTFNAYSVTKTFTATAILQLAEQSKIDLDEPIARYVDRFPYRKSPTIRQTLCHTGGFPNPIPLAWVHSTDEHQTFDKSRFVAQVIAQHPRLKSEPAATYAYSNIGYLLLGDVIEKVSGQRYTDYIEQHVIGPLQLQHGETLAFTIAQPKAHARGYIKRWSLFNAALGLFIDRNRFIDVRSGRWVQFKNHYVNGAAYGGLIGNAPGFARYLQALLARHDYLSAPTRALLFAPAHTRNGKELPRSLGWFIGNMKGETYYTHAGGGAAYYCELRIYPHIERASVVMFNRAGMRDERILDRIDGFLVSRADS